jgi:multiple sugar transport system permease protein
MSTESLGTGTGAGAPRAPGPVLDIARGDGDALVSGDPPGRGVRAGGKKKPDGLIAYAFMAPYLALFTAFVLIPAGLAIYISLHDYDPTFDVKPFVGLDNFKNILDRESIRGEAFWRGLKATGIFMVGSVPLLITLPLAVAMLMNAKFRGRNFFRAIYFAPYVLGVAVVSVVWRFLLDANIGLVNYYIEKIPGVPNNIAWTSDLPWGWFALIGVTVWWTLGFNAIIYLAGLQDIPGELYEAAKMDGASAWDRFRNVTLPGLRPVGLFIVSTTILASANMFGQSYLITQGAPAQQTRTVIYEIAETGLRSREMGTAAAMSLVVTIILMILSVVVFFLFREKDEARS